MLHINSNVNTVNNIQEDSISFYYIYMWAFLGIYLYASHAGMIKDPEVHLYQNGGSVNMSYYVKYFEVQFIVIAPMSSGSFNQRIILFKSYHRLHSKGDYNQDVVRTAALNHYYYYHSLT